MGLYFRKSVRFGPFRVNFSGKGIGLSAGIPGFRLGTGPRGNYVQMGGHGVYYRTSLPSGRVQGIPANRRPEGLRAPADPPIPDGTLGAFESIASSHAGSISDSSSAELLDEIRRKHRLVKSYPWILAIMVLIVGASMANDLPRWFTAAVAFVFLITAVFAYRWDLQRKLVILHYEVDGAAGDHYQSLFDSGTQLKDSARTWHVEGSAKVLDKKYHAGASSSIKRKASIVSFDLPPFMASNVSPIAITFAKATFYFFPDRVLVYSKGEVGAVGYALLQTNASVSRFIEEQGVPRDAKVVDKTWRFVNKKGGPDKRFKNNRELPICAYGELTLRSATGVHEVLMISRHGPDVAFADSLAQMSRNQVTSARGLAAINSG
jgi:Protein of unknown function (DUF4236)